MAGHKCVEHEDGPGEFDKMETQVRVSWQRDDVNLGGRGENDWIQNIMRHPALEGRSDNQPLQEDEAADGAHSKERGGDIPSKKLATMVLELPTTAKGSRRQQNGL